MNYIFDINDFKIENIHFLETKKNIIMDGNFTKITYSDDCLSLNSIYFLFPIEILRTEKLVNKNMIFFNVSSPINKQIIKEIGKIEKSILEYYHFININNKMEYHSQKEYNISASQFYDYRNKPALHNPNKRLPYSFIPEYDTLYSHFSTVQKKNKETKYFTNNLERQLQNGFIKLFKKNFNEPLSYKENQQFVLKISGIWENEQQIGITYKFMEITMIVSKKSINDNYLDSDSDFESDSISNVCIEKI